MNKRQMAPLAAAAILSLVASACASDDNGDAAGGCSAEELTGYALAPASVDPRTVTAAAGKVSLLAQGGDTVKIGWFGDITGANSSLTTGQLNGARLAIQEANAAGNLQVTVELDAQDNKDGNPDTAPSIEQGFIQDDAVVGVIGGAFSGETLAVGELFADAGLTHISPSATNPDITANGWPFFRLLSTDQVQGEQAAALITNIGCEKVAVVSDKSDYGQGLADIVAGALGETVVLNEGVEPSTDYSSLVSSIQAAEADVVFYGGYAKEASLIVKQMREGGVTATFMSGDGTKVPEFVTDAGAENANGSILTCPCSDPTLSDEADAVAFTAAYEEEFGTAPTIYSAEGYDAGNLMIAAIDAADDDGEVTREEIFAFFNDASGVAGLTKDYTWDDTGEIEGGIIIAYAVKDGAIVQLGTVEEVA